MNQQPLQTELDRLNVHPVNLGVRSIADGRAELQGSLLIYWGAFKTVDAAWLLSVLAALPNDAGPRVTMESIAAAHAENLAGVAWPAAAAPDRP